MTHKQSSKKPDSSSSAATTSKDVGKAVDASGQSPEDLEPLCSPPPEKKEGIEPAASSASSQAGATLSEYEYANVEELIVRQLEEDIMAYKNDLEFCNAALLQQDLTPKESRKLQMRRLDLGHQIRHCRHKMDSIKAHMQNAEAAAAQQHRIHHCSHPHRHSMCAPVDGSATVGAKRLATSPGPCSPIKRPHFSSPTSPPFPPSAFDNIITTVQRKGLWTCRLCQSDTYMFAGEGRAPAQPSKVPLRDVSKMIAHFLTMHHEHAAEDRLAELGAALARNPGPFEYWLRKTRQEPIGDGGQVMWGAIEALRAGRMPNLLRRLNRAAGAM